jgi:hypothetical protein
LEVRREQFEVRAAEPLEKIVLGPTGHMSCSGRESATARTLRFRDGDDGSKVHTRRFSTVEKAASGLRKFLARRTACEANGAAEPSGRQPYELCAGVHTAGARTGVACSSRSDAARALCPTDRRPISQMPPGRRTRGRRGYSPPEVRHPKRASQSCAGRLLSAWAR